MASYVELILDVTGPAGVTATLEGGANFTTGQLVDCAIATSDADATGYKVKIWGDVDETENPNIQTDEADAIYFSPTWDVNEVTQQVKLVSGDGLKTIYVKIMDTVDNVSSSANDTITLDETSPAITTGDPNVPRISNKTGKRTAVFTFQADTAFDEYVVMVVPTTGSVYADGTVIGTTNGSANTSGNAGEYPATTPISVTVDYDDLIAAGAASGETPNIVKVFVKEHSDVEEWTTI